MNLQIGTHIQQDLGVTLPNLWENKLKI